METAILPSAASRRSRLGTSARLLLTGELILSGHAVCL